MSEHPLAAGPPETAGKGGGLRGLPVWRYVGGAVPILALLVGVVVLALRPAAVAQPIEFNHRKHTQELQLDCQFCHEYVATGAHSGLPAADKCAMCHQAPLGESAEAARVTELLAAGDPLHFQKLFRMPAHVFYTHARHVGIAELPCERCHGAIATTERPPKRPLVNVTMDFCMACHREMGQTEDCAACHR